MIKLATKSDKERIELEMPWEDRRPANTIHQLLTQAKERHGGAQGVELSAALGSQVQGGNTDVGPGSRQGDPGREPVPVAGGRAERRRGAPPAEFHRNRDRHPWSPDRRNRVSDQSIDRSQADRPNIAGVERKGAGDTQVISQDEPGADRRNGNGGVRRPGPHPRG